MKFKLKIKDIKEDGEGTKSFFFQRPDNLIWEPGSNIHVGLVGFDQGEKPNKELVRHMSIATLWEENKLGITTRVPGSNSLFKKKLSELKAGDELILFKIGTRISLQRINRPIYLISMGTAMAAMRPLILSYVNNKKSVPKLISININSSRFIFKEELDELQDVDYKNLWLNSRKAFYDTLDKISQDEAALYYVVGSDSFIVNVMAKLSSHGVNMADIIIDKKPENYDKYWKDIITI